VQVEADEVVPRICQPDLLECIAADIRSGGASAEAVQEIGEQKDDRAAVQDVVYAGAVNSRP